MLEVDESSERQGFQLFAKLKNTFLRDVVVGARHWGLRPSDCFLACYPKGGSTWLRSMLASLVLGENQGWMEDTRKVSNYVGRQSKVKEILPNRGRIINTHERFRRNYKKSVVLIRDGRDVAISTYYYLQHLGEAKAAVANEREELNRFVGDFLDGQVGVLSSYGTWHDHVLGWKRAAESGATEALWVRYEDLKQDPGGALQSVADFMGLKSTADTIRAAVEQNTLQAMSEREVKSKQNDESSDTTSVPFVRKGKSGAWREVFDEVTLDKFHRIAGDALRVGNYL